MKKITRILTAGAAISLFVGVVVNAGTALAAIGGGGCAPGLNCLDVWNPVICSNGKIYSNACYAKKACATGCVAY